MSRPNLSAIERGKREVSLATLRALALGLGVRPGALVDGIPPGAPGKNAVRLSREALERIADAVVQGTSVRTREERVVAEALGRIMKHQTFAFSRRVTGLRRGKRRAQAAWVWFESTYPPEVVRSLIQRVVDRQHTK